MKFKKKPVVIEAIQYTGDNKNELREFITCPIDERGGLSIETLEGWMKASVNDWIIKGVNGEFYPCKPDIFEKTYSKSEQEVEIKSADRILEEELNGEELEFLGNHRGNVIDAMYAFHNQFKHSVPVPERNEKAVNDWQQNLFEFIVKAYGSYSTVDEMNTIQHIVYPPKYPYNQQ